MTNKEIILYFIMLPMAQNYVEKYDATNKPKYTKKNYEESKIYTHGL